MQHVQIVERKYLDIIDAFYILFDEFIYQFFWSWLTTVEFGRKAASLAWTPLNLCVS
jgi:hypothetical protein